LYVWGFVWRWSCFISDKKNKTCESSKTIIFYSEAVGLHAQPIKVCLKFPYKRKAILFQASPYTCNFAKKAVFGPDTVFMSKLSWFGSEIGPR
jgi:hypothetical protein